MQRHESSSEEDDYLMSQQDFDIFKKKQIYESLTKVDIDIHQLQIEQQKELFDDINQMKIASSKDKNVSQKNLVSILAHLEKLRGKNSKNVTTRKKQKTSDEASKL